MTSEVALVNETSGFVDHLHGLLGSGGERAGREYPEIEDSHDGDRQGWGQSGHDCRVFLARRPGIFFPSPPPSPPPWMRGRRCRSVFRLLAMYEASALQLSNDRTCF